MWNMDKKALSSAQQTGQRLLQVGGPQGQHTMERENLGPWSKHVEQTGNAFTNGRFQGYCTL